MTDEAIDALIKDVNVPKGGISTVPNVLKPLTRKVAGDYPLVGGKITDPTAAGQAGRYKIQLLPLEDRYPLIRQSIEDQKENWTKTLQFLSDNQFSLSALQKQNLTYNLGVLQRSQIIIKDLEKGLIADGLKPEKVYQSFVKNKRFLGNEHTGLSAEANEIIKQLSKTEEAAKDLVKTTKIQDEILEKQKKENEKSYKELYNGRAYEGGEGMYRALGGYHLPKLHEAGIIKLDPKVYEAIKKGDYHGGGAEYYAPDPNRVLRYHFGTGIFDDLDKAIQKAQMNGEVALQGPTGMIDFLKKNDYLPVKVEGPSNALDYLNTTEIKARIREADEGIDLVKSGNSPFFKTPDQIMKRVMETANDKKQLLAAYERIHPEQFKLYQKKKATQPFFGEEIPSDSIFSDLSDIREPKDSAKVISMRPTDDTLNKLVEEHSNNLRLINQTDAEGGTAIGYQEFKALQKRNEEIERIIENARKVADEEDAAAAIDNAISADSPEGKEITKKLFEKIDLASGENVIKLANPVDEIIASIKALEPIDAMKEANSVLGKQGKYKNLSDEQVNKIIEDTNDHIFERDIPDDPDFAQGGIIGLR